MRVHDLLPFLSSIALGLLIGLERERSHPAELHEAAGSRTFALLALAGTLAASLGTWVVVAGLVAVTALLTVGYWTTSKRDPGETTEVAGVATFLLGALAWKETGLAAALAIVVLVLLTEKARIHSFARNVVSDTDVTDGVRFLVMAFVVLPLLPDRDVGPYGAFNPQRIWELVLAVSAISWAGYLATRTLGARHALLITGLAGGFISASATTASLGRLSRARERLLPAVAGAYVASAATYLELGGIMAVADTDLLAKLWPALISGVLVLVAAAAVTTAAGRAPVADSAATAGDTRPSRPFAVWPAMLLAAVLTLGLLLARWVVAHAGGRATWLASGLAGLADAHGGALTAATLHRQAQVSTSAALIGVAAAIGANTIVKCILAFAAGRARFGWRVAVGLLTALGAFLVAVIVVASTSS